MEVTLNGKVMRLNVIPLHEIHPYEHNVKYHPVKQLQALSHSIDQFGLKQPIVIDRNNIIVAGHARYEAAAALGYAELLCVLADDLTDEQITAYRILDNDIAEQGIVDKQARAEELKKIPNFDLVPFNISMKKLDTTELDSIESDSKLHESKIVSCPACYFEFTPKKN